MTDWLIYKCNALGCGLEYATVEQPLSCPYCDHTMMDDKPIRTFTEKNKK